MYNLKMILKIVLVFAGLLSMTTQRGIGDTQNAEYLDEKSDSGFVGFLEQDINNYVKTGEISEKYHSVIIDAFKGYLESTDKVENAAMCLLCRTVVYIYSTYLFEADSLVKNLLMPPCLSLGYNKEFCSNILDSNLPIFSYIFKNKENPDPKQICGVIAQPYCPRYAGLQDWEIDIPPRPAPKVDETPKQSAEPLKVIQITDIHYDPLYEIGGNAKCKGTVLCCRRDQGKPSKPSDAAGFWGTYNNCDVPIHTVRNVLEHVKSVHQDASYVMMTGDIISHNVWNTSIASNQETIEEILNLFSKALPNTQVYPILGNHEPHPLDVFAPLNIEDSELSTQWLFDLISEKWSRWLPKDTQKTILNGGFYSVLVRPGFRLIVLNNNVCYVYNWWLIHDSRDMYDQLQWLVKELTKAEQNDEKVHILSHVPMDHRECEEVWIREYTKIVVRFADTITGEFNGHTHWDEIRLLFDDHNKPVHASFVGGSLTTWLNINPNYRVFYVDPNTYKLINYEDWILDLASANANNQSASWFKSYSFKEEYGVNSLEPHDIELFTQRLLQDQDLAKIHHRHRGKMGGPYLQEPCDDKCLRKEACDIYGADFKKYQACLN